jgi:hypothetical protein
MLGVPDISRLFDDITKAASKKAEPIICNVVLMNAGRRTQVSMGRRLRAAARGGRHRRPTKCQRRGTLARQCRNGTGLGISDHAQWVAQWAPLSLSAGKVLGGSSSEQQACTYVNVHSLGGGHDDRAKARPPTRATSTSAGFWQRDHPLWRTYTPSLHRNTCSFSEAKPDE